MKNKQTNKRPNSDLAKLNQIPPIQPPAIMSNRIYPLRPCLNPACISGGSFIPHRRNQMFCCEQCRVNYNKDKRHLENTTIFLRAKKLIAIDKKLSMLYVKYADSQGYCTVMKEIFYHEGIDVMLLVKEMLNKETKNKVKAYFRYAIELHPQNPNYYIIHKI